MANPSDSTVQNLLPVQAYFDVNGNFQTFIGQGQPFYATLDPQQSGLNITNSTINSTTIGVTTPAVGYFTSGYVSVAPTTATGIANKQYVDYYAAGLSWKQPVKAASLSNIASLSGFQTIDTVPLTDGDRILVKDQSLSKDNGIYVVRSGAWEYAVGADDWQEYVGAIVFVEEGSQAYSAWYSLAQEGGTLGVTALNWANFSVSSTYSAGTGLTLSAGVFSITNTGVINATYGSASKTVTLAINAQGQATSASQQDIAIVATQITSGTIDSARLSGSYSGITGLGTLGSLTVTNPISGSVTGNAGSATNLSGGTTGSIPYQSAVGTTAFLATSTDGYILSLVSGVPAWIPNTVGTVTAVTASAPLASSGGSTPNITITQAGTASNGYLSSTDWNTFNNKANSGANSNITSMTGITGGISTVDYIGFDTGYATTLTAGQLGWDSTNNSLSYGMFGGNIIQHIGEDQYLYIKASATITKGQVIMFTGSVGASGVLTGAPATGITDGTYIMGVAAEAIANNAFGFVQTFGVLTNVNTSSFNDGDILWYDPSVTGGLTATKPSAPNVKAQVAACNKGGSAGGGIITVRINPGSALGGTDSNVQLSSPTGGQILSYNQTGQYWSNINLTAGTGISITPTTGGSITIANTVTGGLTITDDTTTNATRYLTFTSATSGSITGENVSSTKLQFNPSTGVLTATGFSGSGASLTSLTAGNLSGTIPSGVLGNSSLFIGTTSIALNRASASQALTGITSIDGSAASVANALTVGTGLKLSSGTTYNGSSALTINAVGTTINSQTTGYTLVAADAGKTISITTGGVTVNNSVNSAGDIVTIYNNSGSSQTITQGAGVTLQWAGQSSSTTGNRTLGLYGIATIIFISSSNAVITGSGLT
jgi:hypothetical protein